MQYHMIEAGEHRLITETEAKKIIGDDDFEMMNDFGLSWIQDDIEIFFSEQHYQDVLKNQE